MIVFCSNYHLQPGDPGYDRMSAILGLMNHQANLKAMREMPVLWENVCVGDKKNLKARQGRERLRSLLERLSGEDLKTTIRIVDFQGKELLFYDKLPNAKKFLQDVKDLSQKNEKIFQMQRAKSPSEEKKEASGEPGKQGG